MQSLSSVGAVDGTARVALLVVVVLLLAIVVAVGALALVMRRRASRPRETDVVPSTAGQRIPLSLAFSASAAGGPGTSPPRQRVSTPMGAGGGLAVASSGMVCPTCRTEYQGLSYCTRDARRLVPAEEMLAGRSAGGVCVSCRRAYEPGLRRCPHDGGELVPATVAAALRGRRRQFTAPTGVIATICPSCRARFDLAARFCGHDGTELVVVN